MSAITYRDARDGDAAALANFARDSWLATFGQLPYPPDDLRTYITEKYGEAIQRAEIADPEVRYRLALRDGEIVGYCMMGPLDMPVDDAKGMELYRLYVDESVKGAGVADELMRRLRRVGARQGRDGGLSQRLGREPSGAAFLSPARFPRSQRVAVHGRQMGGP